RSALFRATAFDPRAGLTPAAPSEIRSWLASGTPAPAQRALRHRLEVLDGLGSKNGVPTAAAGEHIEAAAAVDEDVCADGADEARSRQRVGAAAEGDDEVGVVRPDVVQRNGVGAVAGIDIHAAGHDDRDHGQVVIPVAGIDVQVGAA